MKIKTPESRFEKLKPYPKEPFHLPSGIFINDENDLNYKIEDAIERQKKPAAKKFLEELELYLKEHNRK